MGKGEVKGGKGDGERGKGEGCVKSGKTGEGIEMGKGERVGK